MRLLYIHQYFKTPDEPGGTRSYWIAKALVEKGHDVTMLTGNTINSSQKLIEKKSIDGIKVVYIRNTYSNKMKSMARILSFIKFSILSTFAALRIRKVDLVFATSTPLTIGIPALFLKWFKRKRYVFEVRDLWPEFPIQMGAIKSNFLKTILYSFEKLIYKNSEYVITLSPGMKEGVDKYKINGLKTTVISNMSKPNEFYPRPANIDIIKQFNIDTNNFNVIYFGAMGLANGLDFIIKAAKVAKDIAAKKVQFILVGSGYCEKELKEMSQEYNLENVSFLGEHPMNIVSELVNICNCSFVCFRKLEILNTNSPNKFFDSLSAAKPIIVNSTGWTKELVENNNCGLFVNPDEPKDLIKKIQFLITNKQVYAEMCNNSRNLAISDFHRNKLVNKVINILENVRTNSLKKIN